MPDNEARYRQLLEDYLNNNCTPQQAEELFDFLREDLSGKELLQQMQQEFAKAMQSKKTISTVQSDAMRNRLIQAISPARVLPLYKRPFFRVAIAVIAIILAGGFFLMRSNLRKEKPVLSKANLPKNDITPGGNKAVLTLGDGSTIVLDSAQNGSLAQQGNTQIQKITNGLLSYANSEKSSPGEVVYNTLTTPKGGRYQVSLPDGTLAWLNAASSIRFPTEFAATERRVEISGEVYFEVAHVISPKNGQRIPFIVKKSTDDIEVRVLGTHFNVNAYDDEASVKITLLEGSIDVAYANLHSLLKPGEQATLNNKSIGIAKDADINEVMAWKNGWFYFEDADIKKIMRQVEKWYNVDVKYDTDIKSAFSAEISRDVNVSKLLKILELTGLVHFKIENNMITVTK